MEIVQMNVPDMPNLKALLGKTVEVPDVEVGGFFSFITKNGGWVVVGVIVIAFLIWFFSSSKKVAEEKPKAKEPEPKPQQTFFNQPIHTIQNPNANVG